MQLGKLKLKKLVKRLAPAAVVKRVAKKMPIPLPLPLPPMLAPLPVKKPPFPPGLRKKRMATTMPASPQPTVPMEPVTTVAPMSAPVPAPLLTDYDTPSYSSYPESYYEESYPEEAGTDEMLPSVTDQTDMDSGYMDTAPEMFDVESFIEDEPEYYEGDFEGLAQAATQQTTNAAQTAQPWYATFLTQALSLYQQEQMRKENSKRARSGLPPLSVEEFKATLPAAQVEVGMSPQIKQALTWGGLGLAAVILLPQLLKAVRR
jgi:hypothetical protein